MLQCNCYIGAINSKDHLIRTSECDGKDNRRKNECTVSHSLVVILIPVNGNSNSLIKVVPSKESESLIELVLSKFPL